MRYSNGNYEAFARPRKPKNVDQKSAYIIGGGLDKCPGKKFIYMRNCLLRVDR